MDGLLSRRQFSLGRCPCCVEEKSFSVYVSVSNAVKSQSTYAFASASSTHVCVIVSVCTFAGSRRFGFVHSCFIYIVYL